MTVLARLAGFLVACAGVMSWGAAKANCAFEDVPSSRAGTMLTFDSAHFPWIARSAAFSGVVTVGHRVNGTSCQITTDSDAVPRIYGNRTVVGVRIIEISSDDIVFFDVPTCSMLAKPRPLHLGTRSDVEKNRFLQKSGLCAGS